MQTASGSRGDHRTKYSVSLDKGRCQCFLIKGKCDKAVETEDIPVAVEAYKNFQAVLRVSNWIPSPQTPGPIRNSGGTSPIRAKGDLHYVRGPQKVSWNSTA